MNLFPCWLDAMVNDHDTQKKLMYFYSELFGWSWSEGDEETGYYSIAHLDGNSVLGLGSMSGAAGNWTIYFPVNDINAAIARAVELGGTCIFGPMQVLERGFTALISDPNGAMHGLWQAKEFSGFGEIYRPGTLGWIDLETTNSAVSANYYSELLAAQAIEPAPNMLILQRGEAWFASLSQIESGPNFWAPALINSSGELAETRNKAAALGATIVVEEREVPGSVISVIADPYLGKQFILMQGGKQP